MDATLSAALVAPCTFAMAEVHTLQYGTQLRSESHPKSTKGSSTVAPDGRECGCMLTAQLCYGASSLHRHPLQQRTKDVQS